MADSVSTYCCTCRNFTDAYALSHPTQKTQGVDSFGTWPIQYQVKPLGIAGHDIKGSDA